MSVVRVKPDVRCVVHVSGEMVTLIPDLPFESDDPVVRQCPWAFDEVGAMRVPRSSVLLGVEDASAAPGSRRNR